VAARAGASPRPVAAARAIPASGSRGLIGAATRALAGVVSYQTDLTLALTDTAGGASDPVTSFASSSFPSVHDVIRGTGVARTDSVSATRVQDDVAAITRTLVTARIQGASECAVVATLPRHAGLCSGRPPFQN